MDLLLYHFIYTRFTLCSAYSFVGTRCFMNRNNIDTTQIPVCDNWVMILNHFHSACMHIWTTPEFCFFMMTSSNGNISRVTGPLCGEFTGHRWIPHQWRGALMFSLICTSINSFVRQLIWDAITLIITSLQCYWDVKCEISFQTVHPFCEHSQYWSSNYGLVSSIGRTVSDISIC